MLDLICSGMPTFNICLRFSQQETVQEGFVQHCHHPEELPGSLLETHLSAPAPGHHCSAETSQGSVGPFSLSLPQGGKTEARGGREEAERRRAEEARRGGEKENGGGKETTGGGGEEE